MSQIIKDIEKIYTEIKAQRIYYVVSKYTTPGEIIEVTAGDMRPHFFVIHEDDKENVLSAAKDAGIVLHPLSEYVPEFKPLVRPVEYKPQVDLTYKFRF